MREKTCITFFFDVEVAVAPEMPQIIPTAKLKTRVQIRKSKKKKNTKRIIHLKL